MNFGDSYGFSGADFQVTWYIIRGVEYHPVRVVLAVLSCLNWTGRTSEIFGGHFIYFLGQFFKIFSLMFPSHDPCRPTTKYFSKFRLNKKVYFSEPRSGIWPETGFSAPLDRPITGHPPWDPAKLGFPVFYGLQGTIEIVFHGFK